MRILIADDHTLVCEALRSHIEALEPGAVAVTAHTIEQALAISSQSEQFDLILLDLHMPGMDGIAGLSEMCRAHPDTPIAVISGSASDAEVRAALDHGAAGFISKAQSGKALVAVLKLLIAGGQFVPRSLLPPLDPSAVPAEAGALPVVSFTAREQQVLQALQDGLSNKQIARNLNIAEATVKLHLRGVFRKLGVDTRLEAISRLAKMAPNSKG